LLGVLRHLRRDRHRREDNRGSAGRGREGQRLANSGGRTKGSTAPAKPITFRGSGLGLWMVATIAELLGFDLRIKDNRPGAVFEISPRQAK